RKINLIQISKTNPPYLQIYTTQCNGINYISLPLQPEIYVSRNQNECYVIQFKFCFRYFLPHKLVTTPNDSIQSSSTHLKNTPHHTDQILNRNQIPTYSII